MSDAWPMTLPGVDRIQHAIRRIVWRAMPTIPGMTASPVTIAEIVTEALRDLDAMQADYADRRSEYVRVSAEAQRLQSLLDVARADALKLSAELEESRRDTLHAKGTARILSESLYRAEQSVQMLDRQQMSALAELEEMRR